MNEYIHISKFSSLNFEDENQQDFLDKVSYAQIIYVNDPILIQFAADSTQTFSYAVVNQIGTIVQSGLFQITAINSTLNYLQIEIDNLPQSVYTFQIFQTTIQTLLIAQSSVFVVTDQVDNTILLTYTNMVNDYDTIFINGSVNIFNFRCEGGFLNQGIKYQVASNSFRDQYQEMNQLYQMPYKTKELTLGNAFGVPDWIAEKVNMIFCLSNVYLNRVRYIRSEKETPQRTVINEKYPFFNFKMTIEGQPELFTTGVPIFTSDWIVKQSNWAGYGTWLTNGIWNRN